MRTTLTIWLLLGLLLPATATAQEPRSETYNVCDDVPHDAEGRPVHAAPPDVMRRPDPIVPKEEVADAQR
jgi:hypothetical protein